MSNMDMGRIGAHIRTYVVVFTVGCLEMGSSSHLAEFEADFGSRSPEGVHSLGRENNLFHQNLRPPATWLEGMPARKWTTFMLSFAVVLAAIFLVMKCYNAPSSKSYRKRRLSTEQLLKVRLTMWQHTRRVTGMDDSS